MRRLLSALVLILSAFGVIPNAWAQNTPFQSPSLDSNCYFPQIDNRSEMDTILGSDTNQYLGSIVRNLGPKPDGGFGNLFISDLTPTKNPPPGTGSPYNLSQVATGSGLNLHQLNKSVQRFDPRMLVNGGYGTPYKLGHFRDRIHLDLFAGAIYWADEQGNFDSTRKTVLRMNIRRGDSHGSGIAGGVIEPAYITHLTSDTLDDIVFCAYSDYIDQRRDTAYLLLFRGGPELFGKDTAYQDTSTSLWMGKEIPIYPFFCTQADFRGVGRDDLILSGYGNWWYFRNEPPFALDKLAEAIKNDTLIAGWEDPYIGWDNNQTWFTMRALPKAPRDRSVDFMPVLADTDASGMKIFMFRGGPDFGSHRLTFDSAAFIIRKPDLFSGQSWPGQIADAGDMTGTGNHVLFTAAGKSDYWREAYFVTGKALDNKIDMYNQAPYVVDAGDTVTANDDSLEDFIVFRPQPYYTNVDGGIPGAGSLWLYYGTRQIPVHLNPKWLDVTSIPQPNGAGIELSPNPVTRGWSVATIVWPEEEQGQLQISDMLGNIVQQEPIRLLGGAEEQRIYFRGLPDGVYEVTLRGRAHEARARVVIVR